MKTFKQFKNHIPETFIAFSNAGGQLGQYERFDYSESNLHGQGGGSVQENLDENLNPRHSPNFIHTSSPILFDPEKICVDWVMSNITQKILVYQITTVMDM